MRESEKERDVVKLKNSKRKSNEKIRKPACIRLPKYLRK